MSYFGAASDAPVVEDASYPFGPRSAKEAIEQFQRVIADRPMTRVTMPYGADCWVVHRHQAARAVLADHRFVREPFQTGERVPIPMTSLPVT
jgi:hypothetical protein